MLNNIIWGNCHITFSGRFHYRAGTGVSTHIHNNDYQIQLVYSGTATEYINKNTYSIKSGDIIFISKGSIHSFSVEEELKTLEIKFDYTGQDEKDLTIIPNILKDKDKIIYNLFSRLVHEGLSKSTLYKNLCDALLVEAIVYIIRIYIDKSSINLVNSNIKPLDENKKPSLVISDVNNYIYRNLNKNFSLEELADNCGYNKDYLYRVIRKEYGMSAIQYVNSIRFNQAKKLIEHSELSLSEIAWNLGFESLQYFSRFFKKYAKMSPSEYSFRVRNTIRIDF